MRYADIETTDYGEEDTLFFIRIKGRDQYFNHIYGRRTLNHLFGHIANKRTISEYRNADHHIDLEKYGVWDLTPDDYAIYYAVVHRDLPAIFAQCRGLRNIPYAEAKDLLLRATKFFIEFFREQSYRLVVIASVDNYVLDVLNRVGAYFGVKVLCIQECFIEGYRRHTVYGEIMPCREPDESEVDEVLAHVRRGERNFWLRGMDRGNRLKSALYLIVRYKVLYLVRYVVKYRLLGDRSYEYRFASVWPTRLRNLFVSRFFDQLDEEFVDKNLEKIIVLPLHVFPEQNVDYWMSDFRHADYYTSLFEAASFFRAEGITLLVKEHPGFLYQRDPWVYETLKCFSNVLLIDPMSRSAALLDRVPTVLVWHGSMGIEGLLRGRKVVAFDRNYYSGELVPSYRDYHRAASIDEAQGRGLVRHILRGVQKV